jgi:hypothetical protein
MKDEIINWLGAERAAKVEAQLPGALALGEQQARAALAKDHPGLVPMAAIRALQAAGSRPTAEDLKRLQSESEPKAKRKAPINPIPPIPPITPA